MMRRNGRRWAALLLCCCMTALLGCEANRNEKPSEVRPTPTELILTVLATGNSDCMLVEADGYHILIDLADRDDYQLIEQTLKEKGIQKLDCIYLTHYDKDHIGAAGAILRDFKVGELVGANYEGSTDEYRDLLTYAKSRKVPLRKLTQGETQQYGALILTVNVPSKGYYADENDYSLLLTLEYGETRLLLLADAMKERLGEALPSISGHFDLVKLPHHGEYNKMVESLIKTVTPDYAVSCVAAKGEAEAKLVSLLSRYKVRHFLTCEGSVCFRSDGKTLTVE